MNDTGKKIQSMAVTENRFSLLTRMKALSLEMTESEKMIADHILNNPEEIYNLRIEDISKKLSLSLPTVFRFTKKLGFEGFKDFKVELIKDMAIGMNIEVTNISDEGVEAVTKNMFEKITGNLKETLSFINYRELEKAVNIIAASKRIIFFAVGSSTSVAFDTCSKFIRAGFNCFYNIDTYTQRDISTQCRHGDVATGISFSGESIEVVGCMRNAKKNGADTICVTTFMNSPITEYSDICLYTAPVHSLYQKIDLPSKMSQTAILDSIYLNVVLKNRNKVLNNISRSEEEHIRFKKLFKKI
jgi:DNA-binding MurR/RpiR family transcriptional regulator